MKISEIHFKLKTSTKELAQIADLFQLHMQIRVQFSSFYMLREALEKRKNQILR